MKLVSVFTESHRVLKDEWFLPSLADDFDLDIRFCPEKGGAFLEDSWTKSVMFKTKTVIDVIKEMWGKVFVFADVDIQFFAPVQDMLLRCLEGYDIACQRDDPNGYLCSGFWVARANRNVLRLFELVYECEKVENREQMAFNRNLRMSQRRRLLYFLKHRVWPCRYAYLPDIFYGGGTITRKHWGGGLG
ncbi:MAG: putative nucleotide-diphospho-sugar transferase, partial [Candidatus Omnitrophota bacterium]